MHVTQYSTAKAAAARFARLYLELPGQLHGINYESLSMSMLNPSGYETHQDIAVERLDEFQYLARAFMMAAHQVGHGKFKAWFVVRVVGHTASETEYSRRHTHRLLKEVDSAVHEALVERDLLQGYAGRDLIGAGGPRARGVRVLHDVSVLEEIYREAG
jgi:hypothetical protein